MSDRNYQTFFCYLHGCTDQKCDCVNQVQKSTEERRCENCWFCQEFDSQIFDPKTYKMIPNGKGYECRYNPPVNGENVYVEKNRWCGKFYSKEMPPPWKPQLIHRLEPT